jgi:steroid delta-isomerase-like uncharacterized protein
MSTSANKALFNRFLDDIANQGRLDTVDELVAPDFVEHEELPPGVPGGREGVKYYFAEWRRGFPDGHVSTVLQLAEDDLVVTYSVWRGTHTGEFLGMPPSGRPVEFKVIDIVRVADGQLVEHWAVSDNLTLMTQIGAIPAA